MVKKEFVVNVGERWGNLTAWRRKLLKAICLTTVVALLYFWISKMCVLSPQGEYSIPDMQLRPAIQDACVRLMFLALGASAIMSLLLFSPDPPVLLEKLSQREDIEASPDVTVWLIILAGIVLFWL